MTRKQVVNALENLVHRRYSKKKLTEEINKIFGTKSIKIDWNCYSDAGLSDFNAMFSTFDLKGEEIAKELIGDFDIYYLKCKTPNQMGNQVYVTEVGGEFSYR